MTSVSKCEEKCLCPFQTYLVRNIINMRLLDVNNRMLMTSFATQREINKLDYFLLRLLFLIPFWKEHGCEICTHLIHLFTH